MRRDNKQKAYHDMYEYYLEQEVLPTYGSLQSLADLEAHERNRRVVFTDKLFLPPRLFQNAQLIEFGPDSGENSLVFALWGAFCTLTEPNLKAHPAIKEYFRRFGLAHRLGQLFPMDLKSFSESALPLRQFDFVIAEGFIYTVKPESVWVSLFSRLLKEDGFVFIDYCEPVGSFMELFLKVIHARVLQLSGMRGIEAAQRLFAHKWNSIPHKRSIESWVMDVLENPFVRLRYFLSPQFVCEKMYQSQFRLYSSWPPYRDNLTLHWFKKTLSAEKQLGLQRECIARSRLSYLFGRKHFLLCVDPGLEKTLSALLIVCDRMIDTFDASDAKLCKEYLAILGKIIDSNAVLAEAEDTAETLGVIRSIQYILNLLIAGSLEDLIEFCNKDQAFVYSCWGTPSHYVVFRKRSLGLPE